LNRAGCSVTALKRTRCSVTALLLNPGTRIFLSKTRFRGSMIFRRASGKSESTFLEQNRKLVQNVVSDFLCARWNKPNVPLKIKTIQGFGPRFRETDFLFGWFRRAHRRSEITFVNRLSILFHKCAFRSPGSASEYSAKLVLLQQWFLKEEHLFPDETATERGL